MSQPNAATVVSSDEFVTDKIRITLGNSYNSSHDLKVTGCCGISQPRLNPLYQKEDSFSSNIRTTLNSKTVAHPMTPSRAEESLPTVAIVMLAEGDRIASRTDEHASDTMWRNSLDATVIANTITQVPDLPERVDIGSMGPSDMPSSLSAPKTSTGMLGMQQNDSSEAGNPCSGTSHCCSPPDSTVFWSEDDNEV